MTEIQLPDTNLSGDAYREQIDRLLPRFEQMSTEEFALRVPACPDWTVRELLAHLAGNAQDIGSGNLENAGTDEWVKAQTDRLAAAPTAEMIEILAKESVAAESAVRASDPKPASQVVMDTTTHEHDLNGALGIADQRDARQVTVGLGFLLTTLNDVGSGFGLEPLQITYGDETVVVGGDDPKAAMTGTPFEILRAWSGRRTPDEVNALVTAGDVSQYTNIMLGPGSPLGFPESSLGE